MYQWSPAAASRRGAMQCPGFEFSIRPPSCLKLFRTENDETLVFLGYSWIAPSHSLTRSPKKHGPVNRLHEWWRVSTGDPLRNIRWPWTDNGPYLLGVSRIELTSNRPLCTRLSTSSFLRLAVHLPLPTFAPARCTTMSARCNALCPCSFPDPIRIG